MVQLENGYPFDSGTFGPIGDVPLVRIRDLRATEFETFVRHPVPDRVMVRDGDVIIGMDGDFDVVRWSRGQAALNQRLCRLRPLDGTDIRFVAYSLPSQLQFINDTQYATTVKHLSSSQVLKITIDRPPLETQRLVADFLDDQVSRIDEAVRLRREEVDLLTSRLASLAHAAVTGRDCRPSIRTDLAWADELPSHWEVVRLATIAQLGTGHTPSRSEPSYWVQCDIPWLSTTDVKHLRSDSIESLDDTEVHISAVGLRNSAAVMHPAGTVGLCRTSASAGYSAIMGVPMATSQDFAVWRPSPYLVPGYLLWCLRAMRSDLLDRLAMGSTHKTIYFPDLEGIRIPLPPLDEQQGIAERLHNEVGHMVAARREMSTQVALLEERKRSLITAAVTGEFDVTTASGRGV